MKIKEGYVLKEIAGASMVVTVGDAADQFYGMMKLNRTGVYLWKLLEAEITEEEVVRKALEHFQVDEEKLKEDVHAFVGKLKEIGIIE